MPAQCTTSPKRTPSRSARHSRLPAAGRGRASSSPARTPRGIPSDTRGEGVRTHARLCSCGPHGDELLLSRNTYDGIEPSRFCLGDRQSEFRESVVAPPFVSHLGIGTFPTFLDESFLEQALEGSV